MRQKISENSLFICGAARTHELIYFVIQDKGLTEGEVAHSRFIGFYKGELGHMGDRNWTTAGMGVVARPTQRLIIVGEEGEVFTYVGGVDGEESIRPQPTMIRGLAIVDGLAVACGMKREVFVRFGENQWQSISAPAPPEGENAGFEAVCGKSVEDLYAVGWNGEIWHRKGQEWLPQESSTNLILTAACLGPDGLVYACGQNGTLIKGREGAWELIDLGDFADDFWDVHTFDGRLLLSTMKEVLELVEGSLVPVDFGPEDRPGTCLGLTSAEGHLWSVGSADVFHFDGSSWVRED
jgi:hypothetical protein